MGSNSNGGNRLKPGQAAPFSGQYSVIGPRGGILGPEVTSVQGKPLPPTPRPGLSYVLTDPTNNGSGRGR